MQRKDSFSNIIMRNLSNQVLFKAFPPNKYMLRPPIPPITHTTATRARG